MKLIFKVGLLLFSTQALSMDIILFSIHPSHSTEIPLIEKVLHQRMGLPKEFFRIVVTEAPCSPVNVRAAHVCINHSKDMQFIFLNNKALNKTLGYFWKDTL